MSGEFTGSHVSDIGTGIVRLVLVSFEVGRVFDLEGGVRAFLHVDGGVGDRVAFVPRLYILDIRPINEGLEVVVGARIYGRISLDDPIVYQEWLSYCFCGRPRSERSMIRLG